MRLAAWYEKRTETLRVLAGPLGFYGSAYGLVIGPCRDTRQAALSDAVDAADLIDAAGFTGAVHAWRTTPPDRRKP